MSCIARALACCIVAVSIGTAAFDVARAGEPENIAIARAAYDRGAKAYDAGQYAIAAREFSVADELSPNPVALRFALQAALQLDDPVLGMKLVQRSEGRDDGPLGEVVKQARAKFAYRVGRITLVCPEAPSEHGENTAPGCRASIDGASATGITWVAPGTHAVESESGGMQSVRVGAGESVDVQLPAQPKSAPAQTAPSPRLPPPAAPPRPPPEHEGLSPTFFWVGVGITTIGVVATVGSGIDTLSKHADNAVSPSPSTYDAGESAQRRTNILLATTAGFAVVTAVLGFLSIERSPVKVNAYVDLPGRGAGLAVRLPYTP